MTMWDSIARDRGGEMATVKWTEELERLAREATPGPYHVSNHIGRDNYRVAHCGNGCDDKPKIVVAPVQDYCVAAECDAEYIAALTPARVLALLKVAKAAASQSHWKDGARQWDLDKALRALEQTP